MCACAPAHTRTHTHTHTYTHTQAAEVPIIVAINKIDKPGADPERVKTELLELNLVPEEWGGNTPMVLVSAKKVCPSKVLKLGRQMRSVSASAEKAGMRHVERARKADEHGIGIRAVKVGCATCRCHPSRQTRSKNWHQLRKQVRVGEGIADLLQIISWTAEEKALVCNPLNKAQLQQQWRRPWCATHSTERSRCFVVATAAVEEALVCNPLNKAQVGGSVFPLSIVAALLELQQQRRRRWCATHSTGRNCSSRGGGLLCNPPNRAQVSDKAWRLCFEGHEASDWHLSMPSPLLQVVGGYYMILFGSMEMIMKGTVIEAHLDRKVGPVATLLVQAGTVKVSPVPPDGSAGVEVQGCVCVCQMQSGKHGDIISAGGAYGKIRVLKDDLGNNLESAGASVPVQVIGLNLTPMVSPFLLKEVVDLYPPGSAA
eukprot:1156835-Pelagomonas_calceolata.AAC.10